MKSSSIKAKNQRWHDAVYFSITCQVSVEGIGKTFYSVGHRTDTPYGMKLWQELRDGFHGQIVPYLPPPEPMLEERRVMMREIERWCIDTIIDLEPGLRGKMKAAMDEPQ